MTFNKATLKKWLKEVLIIGVLALIISNALSYFKAPKLESQQLPQLDAFLVDGSLYSTADTQGKPLLVHFWASWCPTCKFEAPNIQSVSEDYEVITIAVKSGSNEKIQNYLNEHGLSYKTINDHEGTLAQKFKVPAYPTTFIYDKNGTLKFSEVGYTSTLGLKLRVWWSGH